VISALPFDTLHEGTVRANSAYGLGSGVWSRNLNTIHKVAKSLSTVRATSKAASPWRRANGPRGDAFRPV
jgi:acyl-CoA reductase-like NAD-dependent aldehyde dehydrogenase